MQEQSAPSLGDIGRKGPMPPPSGGPVPPPAPTSEPQDPINPDDVPEGAPPTEADAPPPVKAADHPSDHGKGKGDQGKKKPKPKPKKPQAADEEGRANSAAIALISRDVESEIRRWWPVLQEHAVETLGEFGGRITITLDYVPEGPPGEGKFVVASELGKLKNLPSTRRAQIAANEKGEQQLVLFSA